MRLVFFCSTPYQILGAIIMTRELYRDHIVDIYIYDHFDKSQEITDNLRSYTKIFNKVIHVRSLSVSKRINGLNIFRRYCLKLNMYFKNKKVYKEYIYPEIFFYDELFLTNPSILKEIGIKTIFQKNRKLVVNLYEDGTGGYSDAIRKQKTTMFKKLFNILTGTSKVIDKYHYIWLFRPEIYNGDVNNKIIKKIPDIDKKDASVIKLLNNIFDYQKENSIEEKIIFFDQPIEENALNEIDKILKSINENYSQQFIVKLHPRFVNRTQLEDIKIYSNSEIPWEIIALNNNIENKIILTYFSTIAFTNKILFDSEPYLIFLFDMIEIKKYKQLSSSSKKIFEDFQKTYKDTEKIFIPKNISELKEILIKLNN